MKAINYWPKKYLIKKWLSEHVKCENYTEELAIVINN
jgi:hypothetical protein